MRAPAQSDKRNFPGEVFTRTSLAVHSAVRLYSRGEESALAPAHSQFRRPLRMQSGEWRVREPVRTLFVRKRNYGDCLRHKAMPQRPSSSASKPMRPSSGALTVGGGGAVIVTKAVAVAVMSQLLLQNVAVTACELTVHPAVLKLQVALPPDKATSWHITDM